MEKKGVVFYLYEKLLPPLSVSDWFLHSDVCLRKTEFTLHFFQLRECGYVVPHTSEQKEAGVGEGEKERKREAETDTACRPGARIIGMSCHTHCFLVVTPQQLFLTVSCRAHSCLLGHLCVC